MKDWDPAALDCLAALADDGSFERAAQRLLITQSAVSQRLRGLEQQVGQPLVVRSRPLRLTDSGKRLLRFARQMQALRADVARELGQSVAGHTVPMRIAVNADSLATWVLPALDPLLRSGRFAGVGLELLVDDQNFTHDWLREGEVLGCVSTVAQALRGCRVLPLGTMPYLAVASPDFVARQLPQGLDRSNFRSQPFLVFNRKDPMTRHWVEAAFGLHQPRLQTHHVPSAEAYVDAARRGWGIGVVPELQVRALLQRGELQVLLPEVQLPVDLYWHEWRLLAASEDGDSAPVGASPPGPGGLLDHIGAALVQGARQVLQPSGA